MTQADGSSAAEQEYAQAASVAMNTDNPREYVAVDSLGPVLLAEFARAEIDRQQTEQRWLQDLRQYRGVYDPEVEARIGPNRSKAFVRSTRVKVKTVDARVTDLLFPANSDRNWSAEPTPVPSLDRDTRLEIVRALQNGLQRQPTKFEIDAAVKKVVKAAASKMTQIIDDQLVESRYKESARKVIHSGNLYGTGILKAPLVERKTRQKFVFEGGKWVMKTESYVVPFVDYVPLWRFYPDMSATELSECRYVFELHLMTQAKMVELAARKSFDGEKIKAYILSHPQGERATRQFDSELRQIGERQTANVKDTGQYEVLERWGWLSGEQLSYVGVTVPDGRMHETFFSNVWMLPNGEVIKAVLQPINGVTWPYHLYYFDKDETSIFGDGLASIMRDDQTMINAAVRMVLDNAALTAGPQFEANMKLLSAAEKADDMYPFKIWKRNGEDPNSPAIRVLDVPNGLEELMPIINMFKENADDVTAIPRYMHGENATQGAAGTASGMSMLMASASIVMKDLITSYDEGVTQGFIESLYRWNMQFNPDNDCKGDFDIKARGTASLMAKEVRAQQLDQFAASTANPEDAPYVKREELLRQRAEAHDLTNIIKTEEEVEAEQNDQAAQQQAKMMQKMQELEMRLRAAELDKLNGEISVLTAKVEQIHALTVKTNVDSAYAGMQAGGVATERPEIAPAGDAILKSAGLKDHTPAEGSVPAGTPLAPNDIPPTPQQGQMPPAADTANPQGAAVGANVGQQVGEHAGIQTPEIEA